MGIVSATEVAGRTFQSDEKGYVEGSRKWVVVSDNLNEWPIAVAAAVGVDQYDPHPAYPSTIARFLQMSQRNPDANVWDVEIPYSDKPFDAEQQPNDLVTGGEQQTPTRTAAQPPEIRPAVWTFTRKEIVKVLERDAVNDTPVVNSAGLPFDPPIEVPRSHQIIRIEFIKAVLNLESIRDYWDRVNNAEWKKFPRGSVRVNDFSVKSTFEKSGPSGMVGFWSCSCELEYNPDKWNPKKILDQGSIERVYVRDEFGNPIGQKYRPILVEGQPAVMPLNGNGERLPVGQPLVYLDFNGYKELNFTEKFF